MTAIFIGGLVTRVVLTLLGIVGLFAFFGDARVQLRADPADEPCSDFSEPERAAVPGRGR